MASVLQNGEIVFELISGRPGISEKLEILGWPWIFRTKRAGPSRPELAQVGRSWPEPAGAGPRRNRVDFLEIFKKIKNKKAFFEDFGKNFHHFGRFYLPNAWPEPASPPKPIEIH